jgi:glycosyltransferase involved in cell wall biosynthesis
MVIISAVICTYNRCDRLSYALQALTQQSLPGDRFEVIVIDNASTDGTKALCDRYGGQFTNFVYVYEPILGLWQARNRGVEVATGEYIAYLDDDAIPCVGWLEAILDCFQTVQPQPVGIGGPITGLWQINRPSWLSERIAHYYTVCDYGEQSHWMPANCYPYGANMAYLKRAIAETAGFIQELDRQGNNLLSMGEIWLSRLLAKQGGKFYYCADARVEHWVSEKRLNREWLLQRGYWQGVSDAITDETLGKPVGERLLFNLVKFAYVVAWFFPSESWRVLARTELQRGLGYYRQSWGMKT